MGQIIIDLDTLNMDTGFHGSLKLADLVSLMITFVLIC